MKKLLIIPILLYSFSLAFGQANLNQYKYVIVPKKYDFLKEDNKYRLNSLTKHLFTQKGFVTVVEGDDYPADLNGNPCLGLTTDLINKSNFLTTKLIITLTDCHNKEIYTSKIGDSKEKDFEEGYSEALREAFSYFDGIPYQYDSKLALQENKKDVTPIVATPNPPIAPTSQIVAVPSTVAVPLVEKSNDSNPEMKSESVVTESSMAKMYKNETISFLLVNQEKDMIAYVVNTNNTHYKKGDRIGILSKTSLKNVYKVKWKNASGEYENTTGYFSEDGDLSIDIDQKGEIKTLKFTQVNQ